ncbi:hypothetical protein BDB01DRAFT_33246 [Pilobolus umbonatus]|nr:hypothetical protein BDB01DRAFT_33246 [Pilobolus umbonatus]
MNTANNTNNSLFGASTTTNNNNNNNNSLFGASTSSTNNNSLFGTSFNSTPVNNSSLNGTTSTSAPFSATTTTSNTSTPFASNTLTSNTFGTANNTFGTGNTTFGASNNTFGINNNTLGTSNNNTFGTGSNNNTFGTSNNNNTFGTNNSFGQFTNNTTTNNTQASQPKEDLLSLKNCFGDNQVSHFLVKPDGIKRTTVPPSFFLGGNTRDVNYLSRQSKEKESNDGRINSLLTFGEEKKKVLPGFLTSSSSSVQNSLNDPSMNKISGLKRPISDIPNEE